MKTLLRIGIIGDFNLRFTHHQATDDSLRHSAESLAIEVQTTWIPTESLETGIEPLYQFDGLWCSSGSPYKSMEGALRGIRYARESGKPFVAT